MSRFAIGWTLLKKAGTQVRPTNSFKGIYVPSTQIAGEGTEQLYSGTQAVSELVKGLVKDNKHVQLELNSSQQVSKDVVVSWVTWTITPVAQDAKPFNMKSLFVWKNDGKRWNLVADMYTSGVIAK
ncbi:hypothetical protein QIY50_18590 [Pseudomonas putida]|nr:hypothetical protein QIY50_18590 [Pseudomonas putida]